VAAGGTARRFLGSLADRARARLHPKRAGSGLPARPVIRALVWARRVVQAGAFALFCFLLVRTGFSGACERVRVGLPRRGLPPRRPLRRRDDLLSTHTVYRAPGGRWACWRSRSSSGASSAAGSAPSARSTTSSRGSSPTSRRHHGGERVEANMTHPATSAKYYLLYASSLAAASAGSAIGGLFDPICMAVRAIGLAVLPVAITTSRAAASTPSRTPTSQRARSSRAPTPRATPSSPRVLQPRSTSSTRPGSSRPALRGAPRQPLDPALLVPRALPARRVPRVIARFALVGMEKDHSKCTDCNLCLVDCQGADSPQGGVKWRQDECHMCLNCETPCPEDVIKFRWLPNRKSATLTQPDSDRRKALATAAAGAAVHPARAHQRHHRRQLLRPAHPPARAVRGARRSWSAASAARSA
jgi:NAD-dependent dihydropyrimidine dehydrogenase PreA subunit